MSKIAIVTGAASGIGFQATKLLLDRGWRVAAFDIKIDGVRAKVGGVAGGPAYVASKGAIIGITRSLAKSLGPNGVRVNAVSPGVVETPMTSSWSQTIKNRAKELTPLGRLAQPDDVAAVACFLASDDARFVTGEIVEVNGGFYFD